MTEQQIQKKISDHLELNGFYVVKLIKTNKNGIPDLLALKHDRTLFVEVKKLIGGKVSKLQIHRIKELRALGFEAIVAYGYDDYLKKIEL